MKKLSAAFVALSLAGATPFIPMGSGTAFAQTQGSEVSGTVYDSNGEPIIGAIVTVKGTNRGVATDADGKFHLQAKPGEVLTVSYVGSKAQEVAVGVSRNYTVTLKSTTQNLDEVVVTALGIKRDKKALGYAIDDIKADELMKNKSTNAINSLAGKIAGVNITQSSGAAGAGSQIILRGGTSGSESMDNQPLFVVDGVTYDNSTSVVGNSAFDGMMNSATTSSNRVMDINPEDIESMSVLKGPAASALYGSRAANGVVIITTKQGKEGSVEVNLNAKYMTSWAKSLPKTQSQYKRGYMDDEYDQAGNYTGTVYKDLNSYSAWGEKYTSDTQYYDNIGDFFQNGGVWDTNLSVAGGTKNSKFYLSGSYYDQDGIVPTTGYTKTTFRFNGEQKYKMFTFGANAAYSDARTTKTLTGAALYGSSGTGALYGVYTWAPNIDMKHYLAEDGTRYRQFGNNLDPWDEVDNPYWIVNKNKFTDKTERFTGNFNVKADLTDWWWINYRMGVDSYTTQNSTRYAPGGAVKQVWQNGMMSDNTLRYRFLSTNLMTNFNKQFGDFNVNLMLGTTTEYMRSNRTYMMAWNFGVENLYSYENATSDNKKFKNATTRTRLLGVYGELRADWRNTVFLTVTGRNDWNSTLPKNSRSFFYPSVSGAIAFTELMGDARPDWLTFGKVRASWAEVGKGTTAYATNTTLWGVNTYLGGVTGVGNSWTRGNPYLVPEKTRSTEVGLELRFFQNRLKFDIAYYTNNSINQIISPRGPQSTGYIFCMQNVGTVYNKGLEISIGGTPVQTKDFTWETSINGAGNRGTMEGLPEGMDVMYVTDVQYGNVQAATFSGGHFMAIAGKKWTRNSEGQLILDKNGMPTCDNKTYEVANREAKFTGGWNNTFTYKNFSLNMLWEFRVGGAVFNGTKYAMTQTGVSQFSADFRNQPLTISGVDESGNPVSNTWEPDKTYVFNGQTMLGYNIIREYYTNYYNKESSNWITDVNSLRLRSISLTYDIPKSALAKTKFIKRASVTATATNLLLFTNYDGDPEAAASGSGVGGSSSVGFDYCGVPATASFSLGVNLTF